ncbi:hypothetical protein GCM10022205_30520 [Spinactinospora alkalitolerans]
MTGRSSRTPPLLGRTFTTPWGRGTRALVPHAIPLGWAYTTPESDLCEFIAGHRAGVRPSYHWDCA